jgi:hypothetical protein
VFASPLGRRLGQRSGELSKPHPVNSVADQHLDMFTVAKITPKHSCAALPPLRTDTWESGGIREGQTMQENRPRGFRRAIVGGHSFLGRRSKRRLMLSDRHDC